MSTESNDTGKTLHEKFPDMQPIGRPPSMVCINGIGTRVYGRRDADQETGTYIKTLCFCVLFIPLIPLAAYRVADATSGGWYFLGKERLSSFAKYWNLALLVLALVGGAAIGWQQHTSSPAYIAQRDLSRAEHDYKTGHALEAARTYLRVAESGYLVEDARAGLKKALDQCLANDNANVVAQGLNIIVKLPKRLNEPAPLMPDTLQRGLELVTHFRQRNPSAALEILKTIDPLD
ncbi:MAG: hypothetical protein RLY20_2176, partial [Verrucomicrobiota bacterium]